MFWKMCILKYNSSQKPGVVVMYNSMSRTQRLVLIINNHAKTAQNPERILKPAELQKMPFVSCAKG